MCNSNPTIGVRGPAQEGIPGCEQTSRVFERDSQKQEENCNFRRDALASHFGGLYKMCYRLLRYFGGADGNRKRNERTSSEKLQL